MKYRHYREAHKDLASYMMKKGYRIRVVDHYWESDECDLWNNDCKSVEEVDEACNSTGEDRIEIMDDENNKMIGWAFVITGWDMLPDEMVADFSANSAMNEWWSNYSKR